MLTSLAIECVLVAIKAESFQSAPFPSRRERITNAISDPSIVLQRTVRVSTFVRGKREGIDKHAQERSVLSMARAIRREKVT